MATQERAICTSKDRWLKKALRPECRLCGQAPDAIHHIISGCTKLASTEIEHGGTKLAVLYTECSGRSMAYQQGKGKKKKKEEEKNQQQPKKCAENKSIKIIFKTLIYLFFFIFFF